MNIEIQETADGSPTIYRQDIDEHYHSIKGALTESMHVYVKEGWRKVTANVSPATVFEVGLGTGLNAALTASAAITDKIPTIYYAVELYPLPKAATDFVANHLNREYRDIFERINNSPWEDTVAINPYFSLIKINADLKDMEIPTHPDVVYFDAFAPDKQPEMWDIQIFQKLYDAMNPGAILTTYCAKGIIRRMLQHIGFITERIPGPPNGKREILRASVPDKKIQHFFRESRSAK